MQQRMAQRCADSIKKLQRWPRPHCGYIIFIVPVRPRPSLRPFIEGKSNICGIFAHLCKDPQRWPQRCRKVTPFLEFYGVRGFRLFRILWGAGLWDKLNRYQKCGGCCVYFGARGSKLKKIVEMNTPNTLKFATKFCKWSENVSDFRRTS